MDFVRRRKTSWEALVARDELDLAGRGGYRGQGHPRTPRKDGEVAKILKGKAHSAVGQ